MMGPVTRLPQMRYKFRAKLLGIGDGGVHRALRKSMGDVSNLQERGADSKNSGLGSPCYHSDNVTVIMSPCSTHPRPYVETRARTPQ